MSFEKLFYCFVNLVFFSEFKALKDFVRVSTHGVAQRVNLYPRLFCVKTSSNKITFETFDPSFLFLGVSLNLVHLANEFVMIPFRPLV